MQTETRSLIKTVLIALFTIFSKALAQVVAERLLEYAGTADNHLDEVEEKCEQPEKEDARDETDFEDQPSSTQFEQNGTCKNSSIACAAGIIGCGDPECEI